MRSSRPVKTAGLSPRRRGNHRHVGVVEDDVGSIPAQAGEPRRSASGFSLGRVYPRAGGGTVTVLSSSATIAGLSPRRRGNPAHSANPCGTSGSIPAQAGEPAFSHPSPARSRVYPRAGGGTRPIRQTRAGPRGLSPRRRGNPLSATPHPPGRGSIPAQAGEPYRRSPGNPRSRVYPRAGGGTDAV